MLQFIAKPIAFLIATTAFFVLLLGALVSVPLFIARLVWGPPIEVGERPATVDALDVRESVDNAQRES